MRTMAAGLVSPVFAGREAELTLLAAAFEDAAGSAPRTVLTGAEAGGGKSRLVTEFTATVADRAMVIAGGCVELGGRLGARSLLEQIGSLARRSRAVRAHRAHGEAAATAYRQYLLDDS